MRYFNIKQHCEPKSMFIGSKKFDVNELTQSLIEINEQQSTVKPIFGTGNIAVYDNGDWQWCATNFDTSG